MAHRQREGSCWAALAIRRGRRRQSRLRMLRRDCKWALRGSLERDVHVSLYIYIYIYRDRERDVNIIPTLHGLINPLR